MSFLKLKLMVAGAVILGLIIGVLYLWSGMRDKEYEKKVREAEKKVEQLIIEKDRLESEWKVKEKDYLVRIKNINETLKRKSMEVERLENRIKELQVQRESIVVPDAPDDIVDGFRKAGFRSCTRVKKPK